jgi:hypothetical protein
MLSVKTSNPAELLDKIKQGIGTGCIKTWSYDKDGDFSQTCEEWKNRAFLEPIILKGELRFELITFKQHRITKSVSGIYYGRFLEMLASYFESDLVSISIVIN